MNVQFVVIPLADLKCLGLVQKLSLGVRHQPSQRDGYYHPGSVWRHGAQRSASISQQLPQTGQVRTQLHSSENEAAAQSEKVCFGTVSSQMLKS